MSDKGNLSSRFPQVIKRGSKWNSGKRPHGNVHDVGSNPAATRNENQTLGTPLHKVAQWSGQDLS